MPAVACRIQEVASGVLRIELRPADDRWTLQLSNRSFADSLLEGRVTSEPVSEMGFFVNRELRSDSKTFMDDVGSLRVPFRARIVRNFGFCPSAGFSGDVVLRY